MKFAYMLSALAVATALTACANNHGATTANMRLPPILMALRH
jgi:putative lipoprotein